LEDLLSDLRSESWEVAARAAKQLRDVPGERATDALVAALDAHDTGITEAAAESLILRNEPGTADQMWQALMTLEEDITQHMWDVIGSLRDEPVSEDLERRYNAQR
jgi:HEAT repeat protein